MQDIQGDDKTLEVLLSGSAFGIDYYQREYRWKRKQLQELVDDLYEQFSQTWIPGTPLEKQSKYFLGSIVISKAGDVRNIVDGQQRITTLTLLLIHLNHLQKGIPDSVEILPRLIYAQEPDGKKFKLDIKERNDCMSALLAGEPYNPEGHPSDSVRNLVERYEDLTEIFPEGLSDDELRIFIWWIIRNVKLIEITANDDGDAYTIFETMNDRGLSLTPTDMLKGYLLANIQIPDKRLEADKLIKSYLTKFAEYGDNTASDFFKAWLRSQYAEKIRERKKDAKPEDFDLIGTEYHRWVKHNAEQIGLNTSDDFYQFVMKNMRIFADLYLNLLNASITRKKGLESIKYSADAGFTLQHHIILSAIDADDNKETAIAKMGVVANFIDSWLNVRFWNQKLNSYSTMSYAVFLVIRSIRGKSLDEVRKILHKRLTEEFEEINFSNRVRFNTFTSKAIHRQLARFTDWLEQQSGGHGHYEEYIVRSGKKAFEIEHIWAYHYDRFKDEFEQQNDFDQCRSLIGGLLLLPKKINASLNDMTYEEKLPHYLKENILAQSLHKDYYSKNPGFLQTIAKHDLLFHSHESFTKADLEERSQLYCQLAALIWSPDRLLNEDTVQC
ncbi:MAG: DUF262 domain-containing protein [Aestuariivita sp.]|nr:DUF262 domain-containing protein [Aestuariivita sp.]MCY4203324.1 DUF262 domain-containing protein [Aestuariivita sp.]